MSQYSNEPASGIATDESVTVVVTDTGANGDRGSTPSYGGQSKAADVKDSAKEGGQHVAGVAKEQAANVASEAKYQAKDLLDQGREELRQQTAQQQGRVADGLRSLSDELHSMASGSTQPGMATDLVREVAERTHDIATWLQAREPGELVDEMKSFARRRPGAFLGIAAAAGVLVGRLGRSLKEGEPEPARHAASSQWSTPGADPLTGPRDTDLAYGNLAEAPVYGSTVADPVIGSPADQGRMP